MAFEYMLRLLEYSWKIFISPWLDQKGIWMILPLILILIFIHIYFGRHRSEELGWNSAFSNSISLLWVEITLLRFLLEEHSFGQLLSGPEFGKAMVVVFLGLWVIALAVFNFFHIVPKRFAFMASSPSSVYVLAYIAVSLVVADFTIVKETIISSIMLFFILLLLINMIKLSIPMAKIDEQIKKA